MEQNPAGQKMHVLECALCADDKLFCTHDWIWTDDWILCSARRYPHTLVHMIGAARIILGHFRHTPDTIDGQSRIARSEISMFWSELNSTKTVGAPPWRSKTVVHCTEEGKLQYSISGSSEIQGMARGYSFDIRFTLCGNIQSGYSEDIPSMVFLPGCTCPFAA